MSLEIYLHCEKGAVEVDNWIFEGGNIVELRGDNTSPLNLVTPPIIDEYKVENYK